MWNEFGVRFRYCWANCVSKVAPVNECLSFCVIVWNRSKTLDNFSSGPCSLNSWTYSTGIGGICKFGLPLKLARNFVSVRWRNWELVVIIISKSSACINSSRGRGCSSPSIHTMSAHFSRYLVKKSVKEKPYRYFSQNALSKHGGLTVPPRV
jgi:hypothetical protein